MAEVPVTISGVLFDKHGRTTQLVTLMGMASITGLGVGGGPIVPPGNGGGGDGGPPGIWGPLPGFPTPPIANVPGAPGYRPPGDHIWGGGNVPMPSPPIANVPGAPGYQPPIEKPPEPINPPVQWKAVWHPVEGWVVVGVINPDVPHPVPSGT